MWYQRFVTQGYPWLLFVVCVSYPVYAVMLLFGVFQLCEWPVLYQGTDKVSTLEKLQIILWGISLISVVPFLIFVWQWLWVRTFVLSITSSHVLDTIREYIQIHLPPVSSTMPSTMGVPQYVENAILPYIVNLHRHLVTLLIYGTVGILFFIIAYLLFMISQWTLSITRILEHSLKNHTHSHRMTLEWILWGLRLPIRFITFSVVFEWGWFERILVIMLVLFVQWVLKTYGHLFQRETTTTMAITN